MITQENKFVEFIKAMIYLVDVTIVSGYLFAAGAVGLVWLLRG